MFVEESTGFAGLSLPISRQYLGLQSVIIWSIISVQSRRPGSRTRRQYNICLGHAGVENAIYDKAYALGSIQVRA